MHGWYGQYLTAYDTGLHGNYASSPQTPWAASGSASTLGFTDAGLYIGACRDCRALVDHAVSERNGLGYSGTNSGGHLVIRNSIFRHNSQGITPNSLNNDDQPPPRMAPAAPRPIARGRPRSPRRRSLAARSSATT